MVTLFMNINYRWYPEIRYHCPNVPITILGLKSDMRQDKETIGTFINYEYVQIDQFLDMTNFRCLKIVIFAINFFKFIFFSVHLF